VFVSNEVGLGIVPDNALAREFRDRAGRLNQAVAAIANRVVFMAAGLPAADIGLIIVATSTPDFIFPSFMFIAGVAIPFSLDAKKAAGHQKDPWRVAVDLERYVNAREIFEAKNLARVTEYIADKAKGRELDKEIDARRRRIRGT